MLGFVDAAKGREVPGEEVSDSATQKGGKDGGCGWVTVRC